MGLLLLVLDLPLHRGHLLLHHRLGLCDVTDNGRDAWWPWGTRWVLRLWLTKFAGNGRRWSGLDATASAEGGIQFKIVHARMARYCPGRRILSINLSRVYVIANRAVVLC
jgi:hypothetical protein